MLHARRGAAWWGLAWCWLTQRRLTDRRLAGHQRKPGAMEMPVLMPVLMPVSMPVLLPVLLRVSMLVLMLLLGAGPGHAQDVQPVPALSARVVDTIGWLQPAERDALDRKLAAFEAQAGPQIVVLLVATTAPEDITSYAQRVAEAWKIGRREVGDGVLLVAARDDRKLRIEVAKALEGAVPDLAARQIITQSITPAFKQGQIAVGLGAGVDSLMARIRGEQLPAPQRKGGGGSASTGLIDGLGWQALAMFFFVGVPVVGGVLSTMLGRKLGSVVTAGGAGALAFWLSASALVAGVAGVVALLLVGVMGVGSALGGGIGGGRSGRGGLGGLPPVIFGGGGFGGGHGGGGAGGGGFSSGGGGDFGGGGASGDW